MTITKKDWIVAAVFLFYDVAFSFLLILIHAALFHPYIVPIVSIKTAYVLMYLFPVLITIISVKLAVFMTRQTLTIPGKSENKIVVLATLYSAIFVYSLVIRGYLKGIESNYPEILLKTSFKLITFYYFSHVFWLGKNSKLVPQFLKN